MNRPRSPKKFFSVDEIKTIVSSIEEAEAKTSGEIRVHVERRWPGDPVERAHAIFDRLGMHRTKQRNGVLFYLATSARKFAVYSDEGLMSRLPQGFWEETVRMMEEHFRREDFTSGLASGIKIAGEKLKEFFPKSERDRNELPDEITVS